MTDTRHTNKLFDCINALILPSILLILAVASQAAGKPILPESLQAALIPTFPETVPAGLAYPELFGIFAICLVCFNKVRWPIQLILYIALGLIGSALCSALCSTPLLTPYSVTCAAWYGAALVACLWSKANPTFQPKQKIIASAALLILFGLNIPLSYLLFNGFEESLIVTITPSFIGIAFGITAGLIAAGLTAVLSKVLAEKAETAGAFLLRTAKPAKKEAPATNTQKTSSRKTAAPSTPARKAATTPKPAPAPAPKPAPAAASAAKNAPPSTVTDKLLCSTDVPEIEVPNRTTTNRNRKKPASTPPKASEPAPKPSAKSDDDSDWLNKHLEALNK